MERNLMNYCSKKDIWFQRSKEYKCATLEDSYVRYDFFYNYHISYYKYRIKSFNVLKYELYISSLHPSLNLHRDPWINS